MVKLKFELGMRKCNQNVRTMRPKRIAACKVQTYNLMQSSYNEERDLKRALKCSLIEAKAAENKQRKSETKKRVNSASAKCNNKNETFKKKVKENIFKNEKKLINDLIKNSTKKCSNEKCEENNEQVQETEIIVKRFTAHRKFAQNCLPFTNNNLSLDLNNNLGNNSNKFYINESTSVNKQSSSNTELFANAKLTADEFLTFLCFRDYVSLPMSLHKQTIQDDKVKLETRKENTDLIEQEVTTVKRNLFKENNSKRLKVTKFPIDKLIKLNKSSSKDNLLSIQIKAEQKISKVKNTEKKQTTELMTKCTKIIKETKIEKASFKSVKKSVTNESVKKSVSKKTLNSTKIRKQTLKKDKKNKPKKVVKVKKDTLIANKKEIRSTRKLRSGKFIHIIEPK